MQCFWEGWRFFVAVQHKLRKVAALEPYAPENGECGNGWKDVWDLASELLVSIYSPLNESFVSLPGADFSEDQGKSATGSHSYL